MVAHLGTRRLGNSEASPTVSCRVTELAPVPSDVFTPPPMSFDDDPFADFELPPDVMSSTFEHAISDAASITHERGHAVASALQRKLKGSIVEFGFPGTVTAHLKSGVVARCGGPALGWRIEVEREPRSEEHTSELQSHVNLVCRLLLEKKKRDR